jgi:hypothetical protein
MAGARYQEQGPGEYVPGRGFQLVELLEARQGRLTLLELSDGSELRAFNSAAGRDIGAGWEHTTLNISPAMPGEEVALVSTKDVARAICPDTSEILYLRTPS